MPFTQADLEAQKQMFQSLKEEFSRLENLEASIKKQNGLENAQVDLNNLSPQEKELLAQAQAEAAKQGAMRAGQAQAANAAPATKAGSGRKNVVRL